MCSVETTIVQNYFMAMSSCQSRQGLCGAHKPLKLIFTFFFHRWKN